MNDPLATVSEALKTSNFFHRKTHRFMYAKVQTVKLANLSRERYSHAGYI